MSTDHNSFEEKARRANEVESSRGPSAYRPNALPLGQTGSQVTFVRVNIMFMYSDTPVEKTATKIRDLKSKCDWRRLMLGWIRGLLVTALHRPNASSLHIFRTHYPYSKIASSPPPPPPNPRHMYPENVKKWDKIQLFLSEQNNRLTSCQRRPSGKNQLLIRKPRPRKVAKSTIRYGMESFLLSQSPECCVRKLVRQKDGTVSQWEERAYHRPANKAGSLTENSLFPPPSALSVSRWWWWWWWWWRWLWRWQRGRRSTRQSVAGGYIQGNARRAKAERRHSWPVR